MRSPALKMVTNIFIHWLCFIFTFISPKPNYHPVQCVCSTVGDVHYRGGYSVSWGRTRRHLWVPWGIFNTVGEASWVVWGIFSTVGAYHDTFGGISWVVWGDIMSWSRLRDIQYCGGIPWVVWGGISEYCGGCSVPWGHTMSTVNDSTHKQAQRGGGPKSSLRARTCAHHGQGLVLSFLGPINFSRFCLVLMSLIILVCATWRFSRTIVFSAFCIWNGSCCVLEESSTVSR